MLIDSAASSGRGLRAMDEARYVDWYDVVQAAANGRMAGQVCPACGDGRLEASSDGVEVRVRCAACGEGFVGKLAAGRDDGLYAEADAMLARAAEARAKQAAERRSGRPIEGALTRAQMIAGGLCAAGPDAPAASVAAPVPVATVEAGASADADADAEPFRWTLPAGTDDVQGLADWMDVVESIHNGRRVGLRCPYCSEPLEHITHRPPFVRVRCEVCGEGFEGRLA